MMASALLAAALMSPPANPVPLTASDLPASVIAQHTALCEPDPDSTEPVSGTGYFLNNAQGQRIVLIPCSVAAYNSSSLAYLVNTPKAPWHLLHAPEYNERDISATPYLSGADYDMQRKTLTTFNKGRGLGDCGTAAEYTVRDSALVLLRYWSKPDCDGENAFDMIETYQVYPPVKKAPNE